MRGCIRDSEMPSAKLPAEGARGLTRSLAVLALDAGDRMARPYRLLVRLPQSYTRCSAQASVSRS